MGAMGVHNSLEPCSSVRHRCDVPGVLQPSPMDRNQRCLLTSWDICQPGAIRHLLDPSVFSFMRRFSASHTHRFDVCPDPAEHRHNCTVCAHDLVLCPYRRIAEGLGALARLLIPFLVLQVFCVERRPAGSGLASLDSDHPVEPLSRLSKGNPGRQPNQSLVRPWRQVAAGPSSLLIQGETGRAHTLGRFQSCVRSRPVLLHSCEGADAVVPGSPGHSHTVRRPDALPVASGSNPSANASSPLLPAFLPAVCSVVPLSLPQSPAASLVDALLPACFRPPSRFSFL